MLSIICYIKQHRNTVRFQIGFYVTDNRTIWFAAHSWKSYKVSQKTGENACPFNPLYWHFMHRHRERLEANHRIGRIYSTWDRMGEERQREYLDSAEAFLDSLEPAAKGWARGN